ncbi:hypothetical protein [Ornithinimicrobium avium]|uniref:hypothetical protein n=1 Tax=Ornithinimicrobium avium TaxID=2283195 RepID=UPI0026B9F4AE|nr:hypothetical protein [Ornithinimicrobium avium]
MDEEVDALEDVDDPPEEAPDDVAAGLSPASEEDFPEPDEDEPPSEDEDDEDVDFPEEDEELRESVR